MTLDTSNEEIQRPNRDKLTPQEAHEAELKDPHSSRKTKRELREKRNELVDANPGGVASKLDPINYNDVDKGEPTVPHIPDPDKINNN